MKKVVLLVAGLVTLGLLSGSAGPQVPPEVIREGVWNASVAGALGVARYTGRPVLVLFAEDWCGFCEQFEQVLVHREVEQATRRFILVKTTLEDDPATAKTFKVDMHHQIVMLDWSGKFIGKITEAKSARDVALAVIEGAAANDLVAGDKLVELGYYSKAAERYEIVQRIAHDPKTLEQSKTSLAHLRERSTRQLDLIKQLIRSGRIDDATEACTEFVKDYPADMGKKEAEGLLAKLRTGRPISLPEENPAAPDAPKPAPAVKPVDEASSLVDEGMVHEWDKRFYDAVMSYDKVGKLYPDAPVAAEAAQRLKLLLDDPATHTIIVRQKMETECLRWIEMGELYEKIGRDEEAAKSYGKVLESYPDSDFAADVRLRLAEIERRHLRRHP
jgi:tetratricopeptide (TPR) repeat protein